MATSDETMARFTTTMTPHLDSAETSTTDGVPVNVTLSQAGNESNMEAPEGCLVIPFSQNAPWAHPEDPISRATQQTLNDFVNVYALTVLCLVSTPTNILNIIVFAKHGLKERINLCLFFLSISDLLVVFMHFEWNLDGLIAKLTDTPAQMTIMKANVNNSVHSMAGFIYVSAFLSALIAFERCLCVVSPLRAQTMFSTKVAGVVILLGHAVILAGHHIIAARWYVVCMWDPIIRMQVDAFFSSDFYLKNTALVNFFDGIIFGILVPGLCLATVTVCTVITVAKVRQMSAWREQTSSSTSAAKDVALTRMLIGISVLFIVCNTPPFIFHAALPFVPEMSFSGKYYNTYFFFINIQQALTFINSSVNFFVYYFYGTKYRNTVNKMFCRALVNKKKESLASQPSSTVMSSAGSVSNLA